MRAASMIAGSLPCVNPATKVAFPGIAEGSTEATLLAVNRMTLGDAVRTFIQIRSHPFVVSTYKSVVLRVDRQHSRG